MSTAVADTVVDTETIAVFREGAKGPRRLTLPMVAVTPLVILALTFAYFLWLGGIELDNVEQRVLNWPSLVGASREHLQLVAISTAVVTALAVPLGIVLTREWARKVSPAIQAIAVIGQLTPTFGLVILFAITLGIGLQYALIALIISAFLPVLTNTIAGIRAVDPALIEAARGMGMRRGQVLARIELPLAVPAMLAGLRTSIVWNVGTATIATYAGAGGLGSIIVVGLSQNRELITITGGLLATVMALLLDHFARIADTALRPRGL